jgi:hypothetical protein
MKHYPDNAEPWGDDDDEFPIEEGETYTPKEDSTVLQQVVFCIEGSSDTFQLFYPVKDDENVDLEKIKAIVKKLQKDLVNGEPSILPVGWIMDIMRGALDG